MFSFVSDTILDPFVGSGTTNLAAKNLDRNSIGYEINQEFIPIIKQRLRTNQRDIYETTFEFIKQKSTADSDYLSQEIQKLPYIFKDPHTLDKKVDPKKLQFGSKIDQNGSTKREELFTVKEVISPEKIRLSNNLTVKLIGIKSAGRQGREELIINEEATKFLMEKTKGKRVFLKYDNVKYDKENNLLCYLYLENKTFINAHLIKSGLAQVDTNIDFKYKNKFLNLLHQNND